MNSESKPTRLGLLDAFRGAIMLLMASADRGRSAIAKCYPDKRSAIPTNVVWRTPGLHTDHAAWAGHFSKGHTFQRDRHFTWAFYWPHLDEIMANSWRGLLSSGKGFGRRLIGFQDADVTAQDRGPGIFQALRIAAGPAAGFGKGLAEWTAREENRLPLLQADDLEKLLVRDSVDVPLDHVPRAVVPQRPGAGGVELDRNPGPEPRDFQAKVQSTSPVKRLIERDPETRATRRRRGPIQPDVGHPPRSGLSAEHALPELPEVEQTVVF